MGSLITLGLGRLELDWGKNSFVKNHSCLFLPSDIKQAEYYYSDSVVEKKRAYVRPLESVLRRLEMLGYTLPACEQLYEELIANSPAYFEHPSLEFSDLAGILKSVDVDAVRVPEDGDYDLGEFVSRAILSDPEFTRIDPQLGSVHRSDGELYENLDPYVVLRLLAENPRNLSKDVVWGFADVVNGGWVTEQEVHEYLSEGNKCLVVTEGSTDGMILKRSLPRVASDVADFFDFVDMTENYPFTGTGNLFRFCQGLFRIRIQNRILVVLDNDVAGREVFALMGELELPKRMRITLLPDLSECTNVKCLGPTGEDYEDINGRAVSIECFLDIWSDPSAEPTVRWTGYNASMDAYQGELIQKNQYIREFLQTVKRREDYDDSRIALLWNHIIAECSQLGV